MTDSTFTVAEIEAAIDHVATWTGTRRDVVQVAFQFDQVWYWAVRAPVHCFRSPAGKRRMPDMQCTGIGGSPMEAAVACAEQMAHTVEGGREITGGGRIEVVRVVA